MFDIDLTYDELPVDWEERGIKIVKRTAVRGIIFDKGKIVLIKTRHGDYKLPGGGVKEGETFRQALKREIIEETGYTDVDICCEVGHAFEQNIDWFEDNAYFQMDSYYFVCRLNSDIQVEGLKEDYEVALEYKAVKEDLTYAVNKNRELRLKALDGREKVDSTKWPRDLDGLDREYLVMVAIAKEIIPFKIISDIYDLGQLMKNADRNNISVDAKEGHANFVTSYDSKIQEVIRERLSLSFNDVTFVGEEDDIHQSIENGFAFIVDPIDGTSNFMKDYHMSVISVGMTLDEKPYAGVVYNPYLEEFFYGISGCGACCNSQKISVSDSDLENSLVLFGTAPYYEEFQDATFELAKECLKHAIDLRRSGSAALDLCAIASGRADLYFEFKLCPWDFAAGALIVKEAGGIVTTLDGEELKYDGKCSILASNGVAKLPQTI